MRRAGLVLLTVVLAGQAQGQTTNALTCGTLKGESSRTASATQWTISGPSGKTTETGVLRSGPRFECLDGAVLVLEFTSSAGHSVVEAYFPDGSNIAYGRQQIDRRGGRIVLPVQAKARIAAPYRAAFDYHCKLNMPAEPIPVAGPGGCLL